jgi:hypothetical protein
MAIGVIFPALCLADKGTHDGPFPLEISAKSTANPPPQAIMAGGVMEWVQVVAGTAADRRIDFLTAILG